jgi:hypothetical protein
VRHWLVAVAIAGNQLANALMGGSPHMGPSARAGFAREHGSKGGRIACHLLDWVDPRDGDGPHGDHCDQSVAIYWVRQSQATTP